MGGAPGSAASCSARLVGVVGRQPSGRAVLECWVGESSALLGAAEPGWLLVGGRGCTGGRREGGDGVAQPSRDGLTLGEYAGVSEGFRRAEQRDWPLLRWLRLAEAAPPHGTMAVASTAAAVHAAEPAGPSPTAGLGPEALLDHPGWAAQEAKGLPRATEGTSLDTRASTLPSGRALPDSPAGRLCLRVGGRGGRLTTIGALSADKLTRRCAHGDSVWLGGARRSRRVCCACGCCCCCCLQRDCRRRRCRWARWQNSSVTTPKTAPATPARRASRAR